MGIFHISNVSQRKAVGPVKQVYNELKRETGDVLEPVALHGIIPELLFNCWSVLREVLLVEDQVSKKYKLAVGAAVSSSNNSIYCTELSSVMIMALGDKELADAIERRDLSTLPEQRLVNTIDWAFNTTDFKSWAIQKPPFTKEQAPEFVGTAVLFHYLSRMAVCFLGPKFINHKWGILKGSKKKMASRKFTHALNASFRPGITHGVALEQPLQNALFWTVDNARIYSAVGHFYRSLETLAADAIPEEVRNFVENQISRWNGRHLAFRTHQLDKVVKALSEKYRPVARTLCLVAFMPHKVAADDFLEFRKIVDADDFATLTAFAWASFKAAIKIGCHLGEFMYNSSSQKSKELLPLFQ